MDVLGIDVSKADFHAHLIQGAKRSKKSFPNAPAGYRQLQTWLKNRRCGELHACMEATGAYWLGLATALHSSGTVVSVVNPSQTVFFARSQLRRTKTDAVDAAMIAEFCQQRRPAQWTPPAPEILELRGLLSYRDHLVQERMRLEQVASQIHVTRQLRQLHDQQIKTFEKTIAAVNEQMEVIVAAHDRLANGVEALTVVRGIGVLTAIKAITELPVERLRNGKAAAAYAGLAPRERQSGTSVHGKPRICKTGNASLRRAFYMAALSASKHNPILRDFYERLIGRGKPKKVAIVAVMRKLVVLAYTILKDVFASSEVPLSA